jgi:predicted helicase
MLGFRVTRDEKGNIASEPNRMDDEQYIVRLLGQVITMSLQTLKLVKSLPPLERWWRVPGRTAG